MNSTKKVQKKLDELKAGILQDNPTPQLAATATQLVFGSGNPNAAIVFVGEAPGKKEDESGEPFVGAAGKFLNELLASIGIRREEVYITNIVKYRPPENRDPLPAEKTAFWPYLFQQIALIKPKIIVTLGRHSGQVFDPDLRIGVDHGQVKELPIILDGNKEEFLFLPLYHPAAALYNGSLRTTLMEDFKQLVAYK